MVYSDEFASRPPRNDNDIERRDWLLELPGYLALLAVLVLMVLVACVPHVVHETRDIDQATTSFNFNSTIIARTLNEDLRTSLDLMTDFLELHDDPECSLSAFALDVAEDVKSGIEANLQDMQYLKDTWTSFVHKFIPDRDNSLKRLARAHSLRYFPFRIDLPFIRGHLVCNFRSRSKTNVANLTLASSKLIDGMRKTYYKFTELYDSHDACSHHVPLLHQANLKLSEALSYSKALEQIVSVPNWQSYRDCDCCPSNTLLISRHNATQYVNHTMRWLSDPDEGVHAILNLEKLAMEPNPVEEKVLQKVEL